MRYRISERVGIPIKGLRAIGVGNNCVWADEPPRAAVEVTGIHIDETEAVIGGRPVMPRVAAVEGGGGGRRAQVAAVGLVARHAATDEHIALLLHQDGRTSQVIIVAVRQAVVARIGMATDLLCNRQVTKRVSAIENKPVRNSEISINKLCDATCFYVNDIHCGLCQAYNEQVLSIG